MSTKVKHLASNNYQIDLNWPLGDGAYSGCGFPYWLINLHWSFKQDLVMCLGL